MVTLPLFQLGERKLLIDNFFEVGDILFEGDTFGEPLDVLHDLFFVVVVGDALADERRADGLLLQQLVDGFLVLLRKVD